jgi:hypothetical protein
MSPTKRLSAARLGELLDALHTRFDKHMRRHREVAWATVRAKLEANAGKAWSLNEMERTGGEPDVTGVDKKTGEVIFVDCSAESPADRRSFCFDPEALAARKDAPPKNSAVGMATAMGIALLDEAQYRDLQKLGEFDLKTSSWIETPDDVRELGGALFGDRRYGRVFVYHNGAQSYYAARGFRGVLKI